MKKWNRVLLTSSLHQSWFGATMVKKKMARSKGAEAQRNAHIWTRKMQRASKRKRALTMLRRQRRRRHHRCLEIQFSGHFSSHLMIRFVFTIRTLWILTFFVVWLFRSLSQSSHNSPHKIHVHTCKITIIPFPAKMLCGRTIGYNTNRNE